MRSGTVKIIVILYRLAAFIAIGLISIVAKFHKPVAEQMARRNRLRALLEKPPQQNIEIFFCSSAGEYEQALPLIRLREKRSQSKTLILFFSMSGYRFAKKRGEKRTFFLAPFDSHAFWNRFFSHMKPKVVFIIRHEIWPNFLMAAARVCPIHLVDASINSQSFFTKFYMKFTSRYFANIYAVSLYDQNILRYLCPSANVILTGDTKYDRVFERKKMKAHAVKQYRLRLEATFPGKKFLIIGSAWPKDCELIMQSLRSLPKDQKEQWRVFVAPHDLSEEMLKLQKGIVTEAGLSHCDFKEFLDGTQKDVVMISELGLLSDLYGAFDLAFVGGALHHKVHNVLEPAVYGLQVGFGPRFRNQKEAKFIAEKGLAEVVCDADEGAQWLISHSQGKSVDSNPMILKYLESLRGASEQIMQTL